VRENLLLGAVARRKGRTLNDELDWVFSLFPRLKERLSQSGGTLSGGEQRMLAIGRALMSQPKLLLLDEPSLGLAPLVVERIFEVIRELKQQCKTILLVEQTVHQALDVADRVYVMETGRITLEGPAAELKHDPQVEQKYLGR
jgi:branched-chain amino acid transport system ATP-binding protein